MKEKCENTTKERTVLRRKTTKRKIVKSIFFNCFGTSVFFTAYFGLITLQSTMNREEGVGMISQAVLYVACCVSSLLFPKYMIKKFGTKKVLVSSIIAYIPFIASNFYPQWILMIPSAILLGLSGPLFWGSQNTYLNDMSFLYADISMSSKKKNTNLSSLTPHGTREKNHRKDPTECGCSATCPGMHNSCSSCLYPGGGRSEMADTEDEVFIEKKVKYPWSKIERSHYEESTHLKTSIEDQSPDKGETEQDGLNKEPCEECKEKMNNQEICSSSDRLKHLNSLEFQDEESDRSEIVKSTTAIFFGFHGAALLSSRTFGNLLSYFVLKNDISNHVLSNSSCICGADFCNVEVACFETTLSPIDENIRWLLMGIYLCLAVFSVALFVLFLDPLQKDDEDITFSFQLLMATYQIGRTKKFLLLVPSFLYLGMVQGFYSGEFTKSYVGCAWGIQYVGLVSACYGITSGLSSSLSGYLVKFFGRISVLTLAVVINSVAIAFLLLWSPNSEEPLMIFLVSGMWGVNVGISFSQLKAYFGTLFKENEEAAFAAYYFWQSLGYCLTFAFTNYFCTSLKIYILLVVLYVGHVGYLLVEYTQRINKRKH